VLPFIDEAIEQRLRCRRWTGPRELFDGHGSTPQADARVARLGYIITPEYRLLPDRAAGGYRIAGYRIARARPSDERGIWPSDERAI
jgi:hypothetical protein